MVCNIYDFLNADHSLILDIMAESDLILDQGFPVLSDFKPGSSEADRFPLPRAPFASYTKAITFAQRASFLNDCALVFNARATEGDEYSSGSTFFLPSTMKPRCALEALAQTIFKTHTVGLEGKFDPKNSGAEWWTLVLDNKQSTNNSNPSPKKSSGDDGDDSEDEEDDEVGMHFDADYALEEQASGVFLHPRVATITYLSDVGVPTLILDKRSPPPQDVEKSSLNGSITKGWLSHPSFGKHVSFDGRLLHGAPGEYFPGASASTSKEDDDVSEPQTKKQKVEEKIDDKEDDALAGKRITFLVNIWLNHSTMDAVILDDDLVSKLTTAWEDPDSNAKSDEAHVPAFQWNMEDIASEDKLTNTVTLTKASAAAGIEDIVLCNRHVDMAFHSSMGDLHDASELAAKEGSMPLVLEEGVLTLNVGREASDDEEDDGSEEE